MQAHSPAVVSPASLHLAARLAALVAYLPGGDCPEREALYSVADYPTRPLDEPASKAAELRQAAAVATEGTMRWLLEGVAALIQAPSSDATQSAGHAPRA